MATRRQYAGAAVQTTITSSLSAVATTVDIASTTGWPSGGTPYFVVISPGTTSEEKCLATRASATLTLTRGQDGTTGQSHSSGAVIYLVFTATDADESNEIAAAITTKGDLISRSSSAPARLAVGANGQFLQADSSTTTGLAWGTATTVLKWQSNSFYRTPGRVGSTEAAVVDRLYYYPLFTPQGVTLDRIQVKGGVLTSAGTVRLGLYKESNGVPGELILDAGTVSVTTGAEVAVTISQAVGAGFFFVAGVLQTPLATKTFTTLSVTTIEFANYMNPRATDDATYGWTFDQNTVGYYEDSITGALPSNASHDGFLDIITRPSVFPRVRVA
jgi:hypothetical protein